MSERFSKSKIGLNVANGIVFVVGVAIIIVGFLSQARESQFMSKELNIQLRGMALTIMAFGSGVVAVSILGMVSLNFEIKHLTLIYKITLILSGCLLILLATSVLVMVRVLNDSLREEMVYMMNSTMMRHRMDEIETSNQCCGVEGHMDLYDNTKYPPSCCSGGEPCDKTKAYTKRCDRIWSNPRDEMLHYGGIVIIPIGIYLVVLAILVYFVRQKSNSSHKWGDAIYDRYKDLVPASIRSKYSKDYGETTTNKDIVSIAKS